MAVQQFLLWLADMGYSVEFDNAKIPSSILLVVQHLYVGRPVDGTSWSA